MSIADVIRATTEQNKLHRLVALNYASPRGLCNCSDAVQLEVGLVVVFCSRDYGHAGPHINGLHHWNAPWPPK